MRPGLYYVTIILHLHQRVKVKEGGEGETVRALREMVRSSGCWLIDGSIPEKDDKTDNIYNTCTVYDPEGTLVVTHSKVHLFDIDIPGKQTFKGG
ncbi:hypothetical protein IAR50_007296 [Cryptococcus sp. DSM 104548]